MSVLAERVPASSRAGRPRRQQLDSGEHNMHVCASVRQSGSTGVELGQEQV